MTPKRILIIIFLTGISITSLSFVSGALSPKSNLDLYLDSDLIVMGEVLTVEEIEDISNVTAKTKYEIKILQYIRGIPESSQISVIGFGSINSTAYQDNQFIMSKGQSALLVLNKQIDGNLYISPFSSSSKSLNPDSHFILPPLKLFKAGIPMEEIHCKSYLEFAIKLSDGSPVCLRSESMNVLFNRGWIK